MKRARLRIGVILLAALVAASASAADAASVEAPSADEATELEAEIEAARAQLDAAARRLAELHRTTGDHVQFVAQSAALLQRPMLGVLLGGRRGDGIEVVGVTPGSGAEAARLQSGDVLLSIDGKSVGGSAATVAERLSDLESGTSVDVEYERDGQRATVAVELRDGGGHWSMPEPFDFEIEPMHGAAFIGPGGVRLFDLDADLGSYFGVDSGVLLLRAPPDVESLEGGDVIRAIDDSPVTDTNDLRARLHAAAGDVNLEVLRHGETEIVQVDARRLLAAGPFGPHEGMSGARIIEIHVDDGAVPPLPPERPAAPAAAPQPDDTD